MYHIIVTVYVHRLAGPSQILSSVSLSHSVTLLDSIFYVQKNTTDKNVVNSLNLYNMFRPTWMAIISE